VVIASGNPGRLLAFLRAAAPGSVEALDLVLFVSDPGFYDAEGNLDADAMVIRLQKGHGLAEPSLIVAVEGKVKAGRWGDRVKTFQSIAQAVEDWIQKAVYYALQA
jgi:hypothetical protein